MITRNGEVKVVMQDIESFEQTQGSIALFKILAFGLNQVEEGKVGLAARVIE